jgi:phage tail protein X
MSQLYITRQFDEVDLICWRYYGRTQQPTPTWQT